MDENTGHSSSEANMHGVVVKFTKNGLLCFEGRVYIGKVLHKVHMCMSEPGARSWLAKAGIPFKSQSPIALHIKR